MRKTQFMLGVVVGSAAFCILSIVYAHRLFDFIGATEYLKSSRGPVQVDAKQFLTDFTCKADQTRALGDASIAAGDGGLVRLPPGCFLISPIATRPGQIWQGSGATFRSSSPYDDGLQESGGTTLVYTARSGSAVTLVGSGAQLRDLSLVDRTGQLNPTDASGIQLGENTRQSNPESQGIEGVRIFGFATQIDILSGEFWHISDFDLHYAKKYAVRVRNLFNADSGDGRMIGGTIYNSPDNLSAVGIEYESGGGLKVGYTKILGGLSAFRQDFSDGVATSDLVIDQTNSFEGQNGSSVVLGRLDAGGRSLLNNITVEPQIAGATGAAIEIREGVRSVRVGGLITNATYGIIISGGLGIALLSGTIMQNISNTAVVLKGSPKSLDLSQNFLCILKCGHRFVDFRSQASQQTDSVK